MKDLQKEFQSNVDQSGLQTFREVKRNEVAAIYQRIRSDGTTHSFEAFRIKIVKAGAALPGGLKVLEDYVSYPGKTSFGKTAYSCKSLAAAEARFDEIVKKAAELDAIAVEEEAASGDEAGKRGPKNKDRSTIKVPQDKFTMKQLHALNPEMSFGFLYLHVRNMLNIEFKIVDSLRTGQRGKPTILYAPIGLDVSSGKAA